jgi:hypothetical protein
MLGVDRTYDGHHQTDATDPQRTWRTAYSITSSAWARIDGGTLWPFGPSEMRAVSVTIAYSILARADEVID